jgi:hypothetical protein
MEFVASQVDALEVGVSDFDAGGVGVGIELTPDLEAGACAVAGWIQ